MGYRFLEHTADIKLRAEGSSLAEALESALNGLASLIRGNATPAEKSEFTIEESSEYLEDLVVMSLEALLVICEVKKFLPSKVRVVELEEEPYYVRAVVLGEEVEEVETPVKAVTYHQLKVEKEEGRWIIEVVLDI